MTPIAEPVVALARRARSQWWWTELLRSVLVGAVAGSLTALVTSLTRLGLPGAPGPEMAGLAVFGIAMLARLVVATMRAPTLVDIARLLDRHHDLHERMSTALEVAATRDADESTATLVTDAAIEDAIALSRNVDVRSALRLTWPRWGWLLPIGVVATAAVMVSAPPPPSTWESATTAIVVDAEEERAVIDRTIEAVDRLVQLLEQESTHRDDAYLRAVRESFAEFGERLRNEDIDAETARAILDNLVGHLERASAESDDVVATLVTGFNPEGGGASGGATPPADQVGEGGGVGEEDAPPADQAIEPTRGTPSLDELLSSLERALEEAERAAADRPGSLMRTDQEGADDFYGLELNREEAGLGVMRQDGDAAGAPVGAADESDDRAGDAAGDGSGDPLGEHAVSLGEHESREDVALATDEIEGGRRIGTEAPPLVTGPRRGGATVDAPLPVHRVDEATAGAENVRWGHVQVVSRYFLPDLAEQDRTP